MTNAAGTKPLTSSSFYILLALLFVGPPIVIVTADLRQRRAYRQIKVVTIESLEKKLPEPDALEGIDKDDFLAQEIEEAHQASLREKFFNPQRAHQTPKTSVLEGVSVQKKETVS